MKRLVGAIAVVGATSVVLFATQPAYATYPGKNGRISFRRYLNARHSWGAIFTINPDGTGERQVTHPERGVRTFQQDWSPNGRWIAYERDGGPDGEDLWKIRANGTHKTYLSGTCRDACGADFTPFWSPSGKLISFSRWITTSPPSNDCCFVAIFVMQADGTHVRQVTQQDAATDQLSGRQDSSPVWSPDGDRFAFERHSDEKDKQAIFTVHRDGTHLHRLTPWNRDAAEPDWSPNGRWVAFRTHEESEDRGHLGLVHPNGKGLHLITSGRGKWVSCSFSPNGKKIVGAWPAGGLPDNPDLYVMNLNGSHLRNVTNSAETWESAPDWGPRPK
jgi:Tol biopolymer transport system component